MREREGTKKVLGFQVRPAGAPGPLTLKEVEELEQLTQKLMQDMEHPQKQSVPVNGESPPPRLEGRPLRFRAVPRPAAPGPVCLMPADPLQALFFAISPVSSSSSLAFPESCGRCHQPLARSQPAVRALGQLFHITCFTCRQCEQQLQGQQFYSLEGAPYCEGCYTVSPGVGGTGEGVSAPGAQPGLGRARGRCLALGCRFPARLQLLPSPSAGYLGEVQHLWAADH